MEFSVSRLSAIMNALTWASVRWSREMAGTSIAQQFSSCYSTVACDYVVLGVYQDRHDEAERLDAARNLTDLTPRVYPWIGASGFSSVSGISRTRSRFSALGRLRSPVREWTSEACSPL